jgi:hypothetical protein
MPGEVRGASKSKSMTFIHCDTLCEIPPLPPLIKGGPKNAPFGKGGRA